MERITGHGNRNPTFSYSKHVPHRVVPRPWRRKFVVTVVSTIVLQTQGNDGLRSLMVLLMGEYLAILAPNVVFISRNRTTKGKENLATANESSLVRWNTQAAAANVVCRRVLGRLVRRDRPGRRLQTIRRGTARRRGDITWQTAIHNMGSKSMSTNRMRAG